MAGALRAEIPQLIVPVNLIDGPFNGRHVASLGVGAMLRPFQCWPRHAASKLEKLLALPTVKQKCRHYAAKIKGEDGSGAAFRLIEEVFCGDQAGSPSSSVQERA